MARIIPAFSQFLDDNGEPLVNGTLRFLESDTNNTEKTTYSDIAQTLPNTNPVQLNGAGRCPDIYGEGLYNVVSYDENDQQIEQFDPVGVDTVEGAFSDWNSVVIYDAGTIVTASNGSYYRAITGTNQNNEPSVNLANWELIKILGEWNSVISYNADDAVYGSDGFLYVSRLGTNLNNNPTSNTTYWRPGTDGKLPKGADIASATALVLGDDGLFFDVTGTAAITSINTKGIGTQVELQFDGILTLTHNATDLILPGAANITTAAGDVGVFYEYALGDWKCISYTKADGIAVVTPSFRGCLASDSPIKTLVLAGSSYVMAFNTEDYDTDSIFTAGGTTFTVPSGVTKIRLSAQIAFLGGTSEYRRVYMTKGAAAFAGQGDATIWPSTTTHDPKININTGVIEVSGSDTFQVRVQSGVATTTSIATPQANWFAMEIIE